MDENNLDDEKMLNGIIEQNVQMPIKRDPRQQNEQKQNSKNVRPLIIYNSLLKDPDFWFGINKSLYTKTEEQKK